MLFVGATIFSIYKITNYNLIGNKSCISDFVTFRDVDEGLDSIGEIGIRIALLFGEDYSADYEGGSYGGVDGKGFAEEDDGGEDGYQWDAIDVIGGFFCAQGFDCAVPHYVAEHGCDDA